MAQQLTQQKQFKEIFKHTFSSGAALKQNEGYIASMWSSLITTSQGNSSNLPD